VFCPEKVKDQIVTVPNQNLVAQEPSNWWLSGLTKVHPADLDVVKASYYYAFQSVSEIHPDNRRVLDMYQTFKDPFLQFHPKAFYIDESFVAPDLIRFDPDKPFGLFYNALYDDESENKSKANLYRPDELEKIIQKIALTYKTRYADFIRLHPIESQMKLDNLFLGMRVMNSTILKNTLDDIDLDQVD
jgi:hypothetical protein